MSTRWCIRSTSTNRWSCSFRAARLRSRYVHGTLRRAANKPPREPLSEPSSRLDRLESRLPQFLKRYLGPLRQAPVSHITSFLILHEITAIVPLFGLAGVFHYTEWIPLRPMEWEWGREGIQKFDRWARRRGWVEEGVMHKHTDAAGPRREQSVRSADQTDTEDIQYTHTQIPPGQVISPIVLEMAVAWAVTKALLPVRLMACVWATPWFAERIVLPCTKIGASLLGRGR